MFQCRSCLCIRSSVCIRFIRNGIMLNGRSKYFVHNARGFLRADCRLILIMFLLVYILYAFGIWRYNSKKLQTVMDNLRLLQQMKDYAKEVCAKDMQRQSNKKAEDIDFFRQNKRPDVTKDTVNDEVTFILMGPTIRCLSTKITWLRTRYDKARIFVSIDLGLTVLNEQVMDNRAASKSYFLGGFTNRAEALTKAINLVSTKYFMVIDHEVDVFNMQENFMESFLVNAYGYDLLSGSIINPYSEFHIPCKHLKLHQWSFYEFYQYNIIGNVLNCDAVSLYFLGRTQALKNLRSHDDVLFDINLPSKWLEDFFIRFKGIIKVGILPEVVINMLRKVPDNCFNLPPPTLTSSQQTNLLLPFSKKHQVFYFTNESHSIDVCGTSSNLLCSETGIQKSLNISHWSHGGLTTYPFIIESLKKALHYGTKQLKETKLKFVLEGGTLLGMVKLRDLLPWDHGDVDTFVYSTRRKVIDMVKKSFHDHGYEFLLRHSGFHTYVTDDPGSLNGCIVYLTRRVEPVAIIYFKYQGEVFPIKRDTFKFLRIFYGPLFFENHMKAKNERSYCKTPGHHACLPDCRWDGCGGGKLV